MLNPGSSEPTRRFCKDSVHAELINIANWWVNHTQDQANGGFIGEVDFFAQRRETANKGIVLNSRILWFFSELSILEPKPIYRNMAKRAFDYIMTRFDDKQYGGAYWELDYRGNVVNSKKQTYAQCFCIYAFSAYYRFSKDNLALEKANQYLKLVESLTWDHQFGGYIEALSENWQDIDDFRLSDKDLNCPKSMNTHLHVLEGYGALHAAAPTEHTEAALRRSIEVFEKHIINEDNAHLRLFFDMAWNDLSEAFSYGHDIEAAWLLWEAAEYLADPAVLARLKPKVIGMAETCLLEAIGSQGQVCNEYDFATQQKQEDSDWWVQAEALVGFLTAYKLSNDKKYPDACDDIWKFIISNHIDNLHGEWHWKPISVTKTGQQPPKVSFWKAPYHNGRAMMEVCKLFNQLTI